MSKSAKAFPEVAIGQRPDGDKHQVLALAKSWLCIGPQRVVASGLHHQVHPRVQEFGGITGDATAEALAQVCWELFGTSHQERHQSGPTGLPADDRVGNFL